MKMSDVVLASLLTGSLALIGVFVNGYFTNKKIESEIKDTQQKINEQVHISIAVTDTKIEELTREVRQHNNFAQRTPVLEEQVKVINHRIDDLEAAQRGNAKYG